MERPFRLNGSRSLFTKYRISHKEITVCIRQGKEFTGKIGFWDGFAVKLTLSDETITIPIHNILYCKFDHFLLENESSNFLNVDRKRAIISGLEEKQLDIHEKKQHLLHFYLEDGIEVRGRLRWYIDRIYCVRPDDEVLDYLIHKRHILYYKKILENKAHIKADENNTEKDVLGEHLK